MSRSPRPYLVKLYPQPAPDMRFLTRICIVQLLLAWMLFAVGLSNPVFSPIRSPWGLSRTSYYALFDPSDEVSISTTSTPKRYLSLNRRSFCMLHYVGFGWFCYYNLLDLVYHVDPPAIEDMVNFFSSVLSLAGSVWAEEPAANFREAAMGQMILKMTSSHPIPWDWIRSFLLGSVCDLCHLRSNVDGS